MSERMPKADQVRVWNSRRGVAHAARQLADNIEREADMLEPVSYLDYLLANLIGAVDELRAAEKLLRPPLAIEVTE